MTGLRELFPPLGRHDLAVAVRRLVPGQAEVARGGHQSGQSHRKDQQSFQPPPVQLPVSRNRGVTGRGRCRDSSACRERVAGWVSSGNSSVSIIRGPAIRICKAIGPRKSS